MTTKEIQIDVETVVAAKKEYLTIRQQKTPNLAMIALADMQKSPRPVLNLMTDGRQITLIGQIRYTETYDPVASALRYVRNGVDAVTLFTDKNIYTQGMDDMLLVGRGVRHTPVIGQDFILSEYHVAEARAAGASALMLYTSILDTLTLRRVVSATQRWRMTAILQVNETDHIEEATELSPHVIAVGDDLFFRKERDLPLLKYMSQHRPHNTRLMPFGCLKTLEDVNAVLEIGVDAVMVDEALTRPRYEYEQLRLMLEFHSDW